MPHARFALVLLAAVAAIALPGCEASFSIGGKTLNTDKAEAEIAKGIKQQTGVDATVVCPDDVKIKKDDTFNCTATPKGGGKSAIVGVTQTDDEGNIHWELNPGQ